jgi:hypothetical protein
MYRVAAKATAAEPSQPSQPSELSVEFAAPPADTKDWDDLKKAMGVAKLQPTEFVVVNVRTGESHVPHLEQTIRDKTMQWMELEKRRIKKLELLLKYSEDIRFLLDYCERRGAVKPFKILRNSDGLPSVVDAMGKAWIGPTQWKHTFRFSNNPSSL